MLGQPQANFVRESEIGRFVCPTKRALGVASKQGPVICAPFTIKTNVCLAFPVVQFNERQRQSLVTVSCDRDVCQASSVVLVP